MAADNTVTPTTMDKAMIGTSINNAALTGIQNGFSALNKNASQIASRETMEDSNTASLLESLVDMKANVHQVKASMAVFRTGDQLIGSLLDIHV